MSDLREPIFRAVHRARGRLLDPMEKHALNNLLDAFGVPHERPEPTEWR